MERVLEKASWVRGSKGGKASMCGGTARKEGRT